jgi:hypothetical protein
VCPLRAAEKIGVQPSCGVATQDTM